MVDFPKLEGGMGFHVVVGAVAPNGKAYRAGVRAGQALVTLNGQIEFSSLPGWQVRLLLEAPVTLGFDPAPGRPAGLPPSVELRLAPSPRCLPLGIPSGKDVCKPDMKGSNAHSEWVVAEEVVFRPFSSHDDVADSKAPIACWQPEDFLVGPTRNLQQESQQGWMSQVLCFPGRRQGGAIGPSWGFDGVAAAAGFAAVTKQSSSSPSPPPCGDVDETGSEDGVMDAKPAFVAAVSTETAIPSSE